MFVPAWAIVLLLFVLSALVGGGVWRVRKVVRSADLFRAVAEQASDGLVVMERDSRVIWTNAAYSRTMGYDHGELIGRYPLEYALPERDALPKDQIRAFRFDAEEEWFGTLAKFNNVRKDGTEFVHEFSHAALNVAGKPLFLLSGRDISERVKRENDLFAAQQKLEQQSRTDGLTGLSNRLHMQAVLQGLTEVGHPFAVLQVDVNRMKQINDTYGHLAGDAALVHFAEAYQKIADPVWLCARTGGDEFVLLLPNVTDLEDALSVGQRLTVEAARDFEWKNTRLRTEISVGAVVASASIASPDDLLHCSDIALYVAKSRREAAVVGYDEALQSEYAASQSLERDAIRAMKERKFTFHFQPIMNIETREVDKFEMLARWRHPERGFVRPDQFLGVLERSGLTGEFDKFVVSCAERALKRLDAAGLTNVGLSVNLSADAFAARAMTELLVWLVECGRLDPSRISLEILESTVLSVSESNLQTELLTQLRDSGFRVFLDDFGMGYAGLAHLAKLPCNGLKIDRGLSCAVDTDATSRSIVVTLIRLADELGLDVVAEGVETMPQLEIVRQAGCHLFQGYAVARPMTLRRAIAWAVYDEANEPGLTDQERPASAAI
ncbi:MAG: EAL domain-containing protein [Pseudomonadota bacterium]